MKTKLFILFSAASLCTYAQSPVENVPKRERSQWSYEEADSGLYIFEHQRAGCKNFTFISDFFPAPSAAVVVQKPAAPLPPKEPFLTIHGNVTYNFNYRSYVDTPFAEHDLMQHSVQTMLNVKVKDRYPFSVFLTSRRTNSPFFSNATDVSVQFRQSAMLNDIKTRLRASVDTMLQYPMLQLTPAQIYQREKDGLITALPAIDGSISGKGLGNLAAAQAKKLQDEYLQRYASYKEKMDKLKGLNEWAAHPSRLQQIIEEKEKKLRAAAVGEVDSLANGLAKKIMNNADTAFVNQSKRELEEKQEQIKKLTAEVAQAEQSLKSFQKKVNDSLRNLKKQIASITDKDKLDDYFHQNGAPADLTTLQRILLSVKQVGIGRTWIDYSELTVKNISLTGINLEMNPGKVYLAAAAGKVNYRFRDYVIKGDYAGSGQSVGILRAGFGKTDGSNIILTYYTGKKALLNQRTAADSAAVYPISGMSIESRMAINANNYLSAEYARSTSPATGAKIFDLKNHTNEAWSLKLFSHYGNTRITSYYRRTGEGFQSFTLYPTNNKQDAWMIRVNQLAWKKRLILDAALRKNDFESPIAAPSFYNKNVFKSFQVTVRVPKYPFLSVGFYPSSQLTLSNNQVLYENRYNTLNAIATHTYFIRQLNMSSSATYTRFYNQGQDSGFIYFNATSFSFNQTLNLKSFILQGNAMLTQQALLHQLTLEPVVTYRLREKLSLSGSVKWNRVNHVETLWGGTAGLNVYMGKIGVLQVQYDKMFLPGYNRNLLPVDIGRVTFSRQF